ncbi:MAG: hypothetical protein H0X73_14775 [Chthoniobacterales bacterium]|nr:hypothetical protein [Chthoniobacterales bacterium]MBA3883928.1 hypothetical protein [Chthoniobacterales bacterium]
MTVDIRDRLHAVPFVPFTIFVADGREYRVPTSDHAQVSPKGGRVSIFTDDDRHVLLPALLISGIDIDRVEL